MDIGNIIKNRRTFMSLTQEEFAAKLHVSPQAVSRWECGISYPDIAMVPLLVKTLCISADKLLGCENPGTITMDEASFLAMAKVIDTSALLNQSQIDSIFDSFEPSSDGTRKRVLIVDDSDFMRMMLNDMLEKSGHSVVQAENGLLALRMLDDEQIDVCILDIKMPGINGLETLEQIKKSHPEVKVIMLSAQCMEENVRRALDLQADAFVAKPFQPDSIIKHI
ncbi:MAG: response regulator containing CheY-like receiver domain and AraC-type DNA-binding domain [Herbinix sp.]|jgi:two-component system response regulator (stage 0 sporulation protein F)|nr:response regulator containing CheY-like receiver domain and AraC-type DNA-binding domain [Herbinix sp.]